jgi:hypothetical protein
VWSHKVLRWLMLPFVLVAGVGCAIAFGQGLVYQVGALGFAASLVLAAIGAVLPGRLATLGRLAHTAYYFYLVNIAAVLGIASALSGRVDAVWAPER